MWKQAVARDLPDIVSMKSGLEGRNNRSDPGPAGGAARMSQ